MRLNRFATLMSLFAGAAGAAAAVAEPVKVLEPQVLRERREQQERRAVAGAKVADVSREAVDPERERANRAVAERLDRRLPEVDLDAVTLRGAVDVLRGATGANIFVNWKALEAAGVGRDTPVSVRLRNVRAAKALNVLLDLVGPEEAKLGYTIDDGVVTVSSADDLQKDTMTRVYDVRDLLQAAAGAKRQLVDGAPDKRFPLLVRPGQDAPTAGEAAVTKLITATVAPASWRDNGGDVGSARMLAGQLIVTQTPENQEAVEDLIGRVRELLAPPAAGERGQ
jgi:hypothetical protein